MEEREPLSVSTVPKDPLHLFSLWFEEAKQCSSILQPTALCLSTASPPTAKPSSRMVICRSVDSGFVFYSHYDSPKGQDLSVNNQASGLFYWDPLVRQVRIEGTVEKLSREESDSYFHSLSREMQLALFASTQSQVLSGEWNEHQSKVKEVEERLREKEVPLPATWGGYRLVPQSLEFWQGGGKEYRQDRIKYTKKEDHWEIHYLAP